MREETVPEACSAENDFSARMLPCGPTTLDRRGNGGCRAAKTGLNIVSGGHSLRLEFHTELRIVCFRQARSFSCLDEISDGISPREVNFEKRSKGRG